MKLITLKAMREIPGGLAAKLLFSLTLACVLGAGSLPEVDLVDASGAKVGHADLRVMGSKCQVHLTIGKMPPGRYRPVLAKGPQCFGTGNHTQAVAEAAHFVVENDGASTAEFIFETAGGSDSLEELLAHSGLTFQALPERSADQEPGKQVQAAVCGQVSRWFSPWRDVRRATGR